VLSVKELERCVGSEIFYGFLVEREGGGKKVATVPGSKGEE